ncbi:MAG: putative sulfate exporter family transporter [Alphaproteobacteria bacterium]|nr:MAG: putative sulfate exporter family transporter [Alphaproteobacteria bacterium]
MINLTKINVSLYLLPVLGILCLTPWVPPAAALVAGIVLAVSLGNPYIEKTSKMTRALLGGSVMGLGAGMNLETVAKAGVQGLGYTLISITATLGLGLVIGKILKSERDTSILISVGTAICGGSAIAAIAPVMRAKPHSMSVALGAVFLLNAVALLIFPGIGRIFDLSEVQFGLWSALAIHDTSSVVGATLQYGPDALQVGTTVKLARALWIVPLAFGASHFFARSAAQDKKIRTQKPWFILGFVIVAAIVTWIPALQGIGQVIEAVAKRTLVLTLFLIGSSLTAASLKAVGVRPLLQGLMLWLVVATATLAAVLAGFVH